MSIQEHVMNHKVAVGIAILAILILLGGFLYMQSEGEAEPESNAPVQLGILGAKCGGPERYPCNPGLKCSISLEDDQINHGICIEDNRLPGIMVENGEACDGITTVCHPGSSCEENGDGKVCIASTDQDRPFIFSVIPQNMELVRGTHYPADDQEIVIRVRAMNVTEGNLYLKPVWSSQSELIESEKIADLSPTDKEGIYEGRLTFPEKMAGVLIAVMTDEDGQKVQLSINVASRDLKDAEGGE